MSLSASEQQVLDSIEAALTSSDPKLASLLAIFARLASGEVLAQTAGYLGVSLDLSGKCQR